MKAKTDKKGAFNDKIYLEYVYEEKRNIEEKELNKNIERNNNKGVIYAKV